MWWSGTLTAAADGVVGTRFGIANWGFLVLAGMLILVLYELVAQVVAMDMGFTRSVPRLVSHVAMATIMVVMFMMNLTRWQIYRTGVLEGTGAEGGGGLLQTVGWWELVIALGVVLLASGEFVALWAARRAGRTRNVSRLVMHGALAVCAAVYSWIEVSWARGLADADGITVGGGQPAVAEWGLFVVAIMLMLAVYLLVTLAWARRFGLTNTVKRLVTHVVMAAFVILVVAINLSRWQMYFRLLEESYEGSIQVPDRSR